MQELTLITFLTKPCNQCLQTTVCALCIWREEPIPHLLQADLKKYLQKAARDLSMPGKGKGCAPSCCSTTSFRSKQIWSTQRISSYTVTRAQFTHTSGARFMRSSCCNQDCWQVYSLGKFRTVGNCNSILYTTSGASEWELIKDHRSAMIAFSHFTLQKAIFVWGGGGSFIC